MFSIACMVEPGVNAPINDDRAAVNDKVITEGLYLEDTCSSCVAVVCDGVGGEAYGNEAAEIVADLFSCLSGADLSAEIIEEHIRFANEAVFAAQLTDFNHAKMATTIAGLYVSNDDFIAFNVGDSRVYRYRAPYLTQLSMDHSIRQEQIDAGNTPLPGQENTITRCIGGTNAVPEIISGIGRAYDNDMFVLCTDGVWGVLEDDEIENILSRNCKLDDMCKQLVELALTKGSMDNLSIIIVRGSKDAGN